MIRHGSTGPAGERRHERTGECRPSPVVDPRKVPRPLQRGRGVPSSWLVLPAPQDGVRQDTRAEKQRGRRQKDGRPTAGCEVSAHGRATTSSRNATHRGLATTTATLHHGGVLRQRDGRQNQHNQESGRSQEYRPLHPVLLLLLRFPNNLRFPPPSRGGTHSVQNQNVKVSIILTIFNIFIAKRPVKPVRAGSRTAGEVGFEPTGVLPPLVFKTSAFVRSAIPPDPRIIRRFSLEVIALVDPGGRAAAQAGAGRSQRGLRQGVWGVPGVAGTSGRCRSRRRRPPRAGPPRRARAARGRRRGRRRTPGSRTLRRGVPRAVASRRWSLHPPRRPCRPNPAGLRG